MRKEQPGAGTGWPVWLRIAVPLAIAGTLVLFPFDWLANVWPAYATVFDVVFATARSHAIGHATIFLVAGLLAMIAFPALRGRPVLYFTVLVLGAIGQEAIQDLFKGQLPSVDEGRDLLYDLIGFTLAYALMAVVRRFVSARPATQAAGKRSVPPVRPDVYP
jgi:hypothetical protein